MRISKGKKVQGEHDSRSLKSKVYNRDEVVSISTEDGELKTKTKTKTSAP